jgi:1-acyl-sn-glycerol-3-phosphate acyltransferase
MGYEAHRWSVVCLNRLLMLIQGLLLSSHQTIGIEKIPTDQPIIVVSNHQNMLDVPPLIWYFRHQHAKFISKKELGRGIPSISFNLRKGGSLLINRNSGNTAIDQITRYGHHINKKNHAIVIFPEGTRSNSASFSPFKMGGLKALIDAMPDAVIVPFVVHNNYQIFENGNFPLKLGNQLKYSILDPFSPEGLDVDSLKDRLEDLYQNELSNLS